MQGSISNVAKNHGKVIMDQIERYDIFSHWFTLKVYNQYTSSTNNTCVVKRVVEDIQNICTGDLISNNKMALVDYEVTYSAMLCNKLQQCFDHTICCMHQPSIKHSPNNCQPDLYFVSDSERPILLADFKKEDYDVAVRETLVTAWLY